jgi:DNA helicase HerA-like ATPase
LLVLEEEGGDHFFGEPALKLDDLMHVDFSGQGVISLLDATHLASRSPRVYATFLLWLLSELFEQLPEAGEAEKPKLVFFFRRGPPALQPGPQGAESRQNGSSSAPRSRPSSNRRQGMGEALLKSAARSIGSQIGRQIVRGILGSIFGERR